jgi:environmental stress-induced protein Ves
MTSFEPPERFDLREIPPQPWQNGAGLTREIATGPAGAEASAFDWRISVAEVEGEAPFSAFPGVDRCIVLLRGMGLFLRAPDGGFAHRLERYEPLPFSGDQPLAATALGGPSTDFNVMTRRGRVQAKVTVLRGDARLPRAAAGLVFCSEGVWQIDGPASWALATWQGLLWRDGRPELTFRPRSKADSFLLVVDLSPA